MRGQFFFLHMDDSNVVMHINAPTLGCYNHVLSFFAFFFLQLLHFAQNRAALTSFLSFGAATLCAKPQSLLLHTFFCLPTLVCCCYRQGHSTSASRFKDVFSPWVSPFRAYIHNTTSSAFNHLLQFVACHTSHTHSQLLVLEHEQLVCLLITLCLLWVIYTQTHGIWAHNTLLLSTQPWW